MANELFAAIKGGDTKAVERLLDMDRALVEARDETGLSPVLAAQAIRYSITLAAAMPKCNDSVPLWRTG